MVHVLCSGIRLLLTVKLPLQPDFSFTCHLELAAGCDSPEIPGSRGQCKKVLVIVFVLHQVPSKALIYQLQGSTFVYSHWYNLFVGVKHCGNGLCKIMATVSFMDS